MDIRGVPWCATRVCAARVCVAVLLVQLCDGFSPLPCALPRLPLHTVQRFGPGSAGGRQGEILQRANPRRAASLTRVEAAGENDIEKGNKFQSLARKIKVAGIAATALAATLLLSRVLHTISSVFFLGVAGVIVFTGFKVWKWNRDFDEKYPE